MKGIVEREKEEGCTLVIESNENDWREKERARGKERGESYRLHWE